MKRVIIVHGWEGSPEEGWFPWLKEQLEQNGFAVTVPQMPEPAKPRIQTWVPAISEVVGACDEETYFVGHSMGVQTIVRYLAGLPEHTRAGGAVFVAGFFKRLTGLGHDPATQETDRHWLETPTDLSKAAAHMKQSVAIFSDNDPFVPLDNQDDFRERLQSRIIIVPHMGHFSGSDGVTELPIVLEELLEISQ